MIEVCSMHVFEDYRMKLTKHRSYKRGERAGKREYIGGVSLFKVYLMHVWSYHNEICSYYQCVLTKICNKTLRNNKKHKII
jgi:hypothetical protein